MCIRDSIHIVVVALDLRVDPGSLSAADALRSDAAHTALGCLLYTSDAADERSSVDLGGRRIIKKKKE